MRRLAFAVALLTTAAMTGCGGPETPPAAPSVAGAWLVMMYGGDGASYRCTGRMELTQDGETVSGHFACGPDDTALTGSASAGDVRLSVGTLGVEAVDRVGLNGRELFGSWGGGVFRAYKLGD